MNDYRPNTVHWTASRTKKQVNGTVNGRWCRQRAQRLNNGRLYLQESATGESWERRGCRPGILMHDDEVHMLILGVYWLGLYWCGGILSRFILRRFDTDVVHTDVVHTEAIHTDWVGREWLQHKPIRFRFRCNLIRVLLKSSAVWSIQAPVCRSERSLCKLASSNLARCRLGWPGLHGRIRERSLERSRRNRLVPGWVREMERMQRLAKRLEEFGLEVILWVLDRVRSNFRDA